MVNASCWNKRQPPCPSTKLTATHLLPQWPVYDTDYTSMGFLHLSSSPALLFPSMSIFFPLHLALFLHHLLPYSSVSHSPYLFCPSTSLPSPPITPSIQCFPPMNKAFPLCLCWVGKLSGGRRIVKVERGGKRGEVWGQNINNKNIKLQEKIKR